MVFFRELKKEEKLSLQEEKQLAAKKREEQKERLKNDYLKQVEQLNADFEVIVNEKNEEIEKIEEERAEKLKEIIRPILPEGIILYGLILKEDSLYANFLHKHFSISITLRGKGDHYEDALFVSSSKINVLTTSMRKEEALSISTTLQNTLNRELLKRTNNHIRALVDPNILLIEDPDVYRVNLLPTDRKFIELKLKGLSNEEICEEMQISPLKLKKLSLYLEREIFY